MARSGVFRRRKRIGESCCNAWEKVIGVVWEGERVERGERMVKGVGWDLGCRGAWR